MSEEQDRPESLYKVVHATRKEKAYSWIIGLLLGFCVGLMYGFYHWVM
jgi:hypothetical protein